MLPKNTHFYLYGKRLVAIRERSDLNYDLIAFSSHDKTFMPEPRLYAAMLFDRDDLVKSIGRQEFCRLLKERGGKVEDLARMLDEGLNGVHKNEHQNLEKNDIDYAEFIGLHPIDCESNIFTRELRDEEDA